MRSEPAGLEEASYLGISLAELTHCERALASQLAPSLAALKFDKAIQSLAKALHNTDNLVDHDRKRRLKPTLAGIGVNKPW
ncbi:hypothetical protein [Catelliglobosispora koreensis]|uniref:hypothetical protein n=1 Tax=Catelliglobosispora koreensis TaxID=129052 RepID=UPI00037C080D|nr:hypothetical protein [Catelliglobosispora koreensis]